MLEEKIELLYNTIIERQHQWDEYVQMFGEDNILTKSIFHSIVGLEEAFQLLSGRTFTSVLIERVRNACNDTSAILYNTASVWA